MDTQPMTETAPKAADPAQANVGASPLFWDQSRPASKYQR